MKNNNQGNTTTQRWPTPMKGYAALLFSICGSLLGGRPTIGAEVLVIQYQTAEVQIYRQDFEAMAQEGKLPAQINALLGEDIQIPPEIQQILSEPIKLPAASKAFLNSDTAEFLLGRLDRLIGNTTGQESKNLSYLKSALTDAAIQQEFSFLDLIRQYPQETVTVNLTEIETTYQQVINFVGNIKAESNPARKILADLFCNCPQTANNPNHAPTAQSALSASHCLQNGSADSAKKQTP